MKHLGTVRLETPRLILRRFTKEDGQAMFDNWCSDDEVTKYLTWPTHKNIDDTMCFLNYLLNGYSDDAFYQWGIELKDNHELIGNISIVEISEKAECVELGWVLARKHWGQGYMGEAANRLLDFFFDEVGAQCVCAIHDVNNPKSGRVMQKIGMKYEGTLRAAKTNNQGIVDCARYSILKNERLNIRELNNSDLQKVAGGNSYPDYSSDGPNPNGAAIVERAMSCIGQPYIWGGVGPDGYDDSGLVSYCVSGSHTRIGTRETFMNWTRVSSPAAGDICVNAGHCGIYVGQGQMIHAPTFGQAVCESNVQPGMIYVRQ